MPNAFCGFYYGQITERQVIMKNICKYCGLEYEAKTKRSMYCSKQCSRSADRDNKRIKYVGKREQSCVICGANLPKYKTRYCSRECLIKGGQIRKGKVQTTRKIIRYCVVCGKEFETWKGRKITCSVECSRKKKNIDRQYKGIVIDSDITLKKLAERDHNQCQICGFFVNWNDYSFKDQFMICGNLYPSVDHVIPISKGGLHSWNNVQLAHRICNSKKNNKIAI